MKKILSFLSYHNAIPLAAVVLTMGAGITFAATQGVLPLPSIASLPASDSSASGDVDASALLAANLDTFDFRPTVTGVVETDSLYIVSYSIETLAPEGSEWTTSSKTGEFSVAKDVLGDSGLNAYVVGKLHDIENGERSYLARAQTAEKTLADVRVAKPASAFAALVGLALDQIFVPVIEKPAPELQPQETPPAQPIPTPAETVVPAPSVEDSPAPETATSTPESAATSTDQTVQPTESSDDTSTPEPIATSTPESN